MVSKGLVMINMFEVGSSRFCCQYVSTLLIHWLVMVIIMTGTPSPN